MDAAGTAHRNERIIGAVLFLFSAVSILTTVGIVAVLLYESRRSSGRSRLEFLTGPAVDAAVPDQQFGVLPLLTGSLLVAVGAAASRCRSGWRRHLPERVRVTPACAAC
jgi:ABC-type phosphate transport system permease subunit